MGIRFKVIYNRRNAITLDKNHWTMNSQITLVEPSFDEEPALVLILLPDNVKNCNIVRRGDGQLFYRIKSNLQLTKTYYQNATSDIPIAVLERKEFISDKVIFKGQQSRKLSAWLKHSGIFGLKFPVTFQEGDQSYIWKSNIVGQLSLYNTQSPDTPIAWFEPLRRRVVDGVLTSYHAYLALQPPAIEIQDTIVVSLLILEQKARMDRKADALVAGRAAAFVI